MSTDEGRSLGLEPRDDATTELAATLGLEPAEFARLFGTGWSALPTDDMGHDFDMDPSGGLGMDVTPWHIAGDPPVLMLRAFSHGVFLARPEAYWRHGTHGLAYRERDMAYLSRKDVGIDRVEAVVRPLLHRRRRTMRYCSYCRNQTPPEELVGDACPGCARSWGELVF